MGDSVFNYSNKCTFQNLPSLHYIYIGSDCFGLVRTFRIEELSQLKRIRIGKNSFSQKKNQFGSDKSKSFHIVNCEALLSIDIDEFSFIDFGGDFELTNLPLLDYIRIGELGCWSRNFYNSSFAIRGIIRPRFWLIDLPKLRSVILGNDAFEFSLSTVFESIKYERSIWLY